MSCAKCDGPVVMIEVALKGAAAQMRSCSQCGGRSWAIDGRTVGLDELLAAVPSRRRRAA